MLPFIFWLLSHSNAGNEFFRAHLAFAVAETSFSYYFLTIGGVAAWIALMLRWRAKITEKRVAAATLQVLVLSLAITPWLGAVLQQPVKDAALMSKEIDASVVRWRYTVPSFSLYREAVTKEREPEPGEVAVTRADRLPEELDGLEVLFQREAVTLLKRLEPAAGEAPAMQEAEGNTVAEDDGASDDADSPDGEPGA